MNINKLHFDVNSVVLSASMKHFSHQSHTKKTKWKQRNIIKITSKQIALLSSKPNCWFTTTKHTDSQTKKEKYNYCIGYVCVCERFSCGAAIVRYNSCSVIVALSNINIDGFQSTAATDQITCRLSFSCRHLWINDDRIVFFFMREQEKVAHFCQMIHECCIFERDVFFCRLNLESGDKLKKISIGNGI